MRYYPEGDPNLYLEYGNCWHYCRTPRRKWPQHKFPPSTTIPYYRDFEGAKLNKITEKELIFENWLETNRRDDAVLNCNYRGARFIRLTKDDPYGFGFSPLPMNLAQILEMQRIAKEKAVAEAKEAARLAKLEKERLKAEKKAGGKRK